jgi:predicted nuclease of predicted toxin-antitoxin system
MKILLDECLPRRLKRWFPKHDCRTVPEAGFAGRKNGELLRLAEAQGFQVLLTIDKGIEYQQNLSDRQIAVIVMRARSNRLQALTPHLPACQAALETVQPGQIIRLV